MKIVIDTAVDKIDSALLAELLTSLAAYPAQPVAAAAPEEAIATQEVVAAKKKRKRRTKAQIAADKAAEAAAAQMANTIREDQDVTAEKVVEAPPVEPAPEPEPAPAVIDVETVKSAVVQAIARLKEKVDADPLYDGPSPTANVVASLEEVTGKKRVGDISPDQYGQVVAALGIL